jgi:hypothetical protein
VNVDMQTPLSTNEIRKLLADANIDFEVAVNQALNAYLPKLILSCPFTNQPCINKQCMGCESANK